MHDFQSQGYSLFETFPAQRGRFRDLKAHWRRLSQSAAALDLDAPDWPTFQRLVWDFHDPDQSQVIRFTLVREGGRWAPNTPVTTSHRLHKRPWPGPKTAPARLTLSQLELGREDPMRFHKTGSRLIYQLGLQRALGAGFDDCLFADVDRRILETAVSNVFLFLNGAWVTPALDLCLLPGVARARLLAAGEAVEAVIGVDDLPAVTAAVITNAVMGMRPVCLLDGQHLDVATAAGLIQRVGDLPFSHP